MSHTAHQKRKSGGTTVSILTGLAGDVGKMLHDIHGVRGVTCAKVRGCRGELRVKLSWGDGKPFVITVSDRDRGERDLVVDTARHGAVARLLKKKLVAEKLYAARGKTPRNLPNQMEKAA